jgi:ribosome biogenesis GTPase
LVLNKADLLLLWVANLRTLLRWLVCDRSSGIKVLELSASSGTSLVISLSRIERPCQCICQSSPVGKSSLIQRAATGIDLRVELSSQRTGTHTTTTAKPISGDVGDSPGIHEFGLTHISHRPAGRVYRVRCFSWLAKFRDCAICMNG